MDNELVKRYTALKAAADDIALKRSAAMARVEDAKKALGEVISEVRDSGYGSVAELKAAIEANEAELNVLLQDAEEKLKAGGYA
jgi:hypothetical protein